MEPNQTQPVQPTPVQTHSDGLSYDTKTIITVILLLTFYPIGLVLLWIWMKWPTWVKVLISLPVLFIPLVILGFFAMVTLVSVNPAAQIDKAKCISECETAANKQVCISSCSSSSDSL